MRSWILAVVGVMAAAPPILAQRVVYGDTIVEIVGLRTWTVEALESEVRRFSPRTTLASSACAVILRDSVGFAEAAAFVSTTRGSDTTWVLLTVVEPEDSALVRYDRDRRRPISIPRDWEELDAILRDNATAVSPLQHPEVLLDGATETLWGAVPEITLFIREGIREHSTPIDQAIAYELLEQSSDATPRRLAALVATNFAEDDRTWHALVRGVLAGSDLGTSTATMVLRALTRAGRFTVDWSDAEEALAAVFGGTNLFAYGAVLTSLAETDVDLSLGHRLARQNPFLLVDHALAENPMAAASARRFLEHIGAPDLRSGREAVLDWLGVDSLPSARFRSPKVTRGV
jgi:hypothetical protein